MALCQWSVIIRQAVKFIFFLTLKNLQSVVYLEEVVLNTKPFGWNFSERKITFRRGEEFITPNKQEKTQMKLIERRENKMLKIYNIKLPFVYFSHLFKTARLAVRSSFNPTRIWSKSFIYIYNLFMFLSVYFTDEISVAWLSFNSIRIWSEELESCS